MLGTIPKGENDLEGLIDQIGSALDDWNFSREIQEISESDVRQEAMSSHSQESNSIQDLLDHIIQNDDVFGHNGGEQDPFQLSNIIKKEDDPRKVRFSETVFEKTISSGISSLKADSSREFFSSIHTGLNEIDQEFDMNESIDRLEHRDLEIDRESCLSPLGHHDIGKNPMQQSSTVASLGNKQSPTITMACSDPFAESHTYGTDSLPSRSEGLIIRSPIGSSGTSQSFLPKGSLSSPTRRLGQPYNTREDNMEQSIALDVESPWKAYQMAFEDPRSDDFEQLAKDQESAFMQQEDVEFNLDEAFAQAEELSFLQSQDSSRNSVLSIVESFHDDKSILAAATDALQIKTSESLTTPHTQRTLPPLNPLVSPGAFFASRSGKLGALGKMIPSRERPIWYTPRTDDKGQIIDPIGQTPSEREEKKAKQGLVAQQVRPPLYVSPNLGHQELQEIQHSDEHCLQEEKYLPTSDHLEHFPRDGAVSPLSELGRDDIGTQNWQDVTEAPRLSYLSALDEPSNNVLESSAGIESPLDDGPMSIEALGDSSIPSSNMIRQAPQVKNNVTKQNSASQVLSKFSELHQRQSLKEWYDNVLNGDVPYEDPNPVPNQSYYTKNSGEDLNHLIKSDYHICIPERLTDFRASDYGKGTKQQAIHIEIGPLSPKFIKRITITVQNKSRKSTGWKMNSVGQTYLLGNGKTESRPLDYEVFKFSTLAGILEGGGVSELTLMFSPLLAGTYIHTMHLRANARTITIHIKGICSSVRKHSQNVRSNASSLTKARSSRIPNVASLEHELPNRSLNAAKDSFALMKSSPKPNNDQILNQISSPLREVENIHMSFANHNDSYCSPRPSIPSRPNAPCPTTGGSADQTRTFSPSTLKSDMSTPSQHELSILHVHDRHSSSPNPHQSLEFPLTFLGRKNNIEIQLCNSTQEDVHLNIETKSPFFLPTKGLTVPKRAFVRLPIVFFPREMGVYEEQLIIRRIDHPNQDASTMHIIQLVVLQGIAV